MLDLLMLGILAVSIALVGLLIHWCHKQVDTTNKGRKYFYDRTWSYRRANGCVPGLRVGTPGKILKLTGGIHYGAAHTDHSHLFDNGHSSGIYVYHIAAGKHTFAIPCLTMWTM